MNPPFSGFVLDPSKCSKMSIHEKRELVHELSKWPESAPEKLQAWSRRDLLEILCAEMGKERKYTGLTKHKLIEQLFRILSEKKSGKCMDDIDISQQMHPSISQTPAKRQRKTDHPLRFPIQSNNHSMEHVSEAMATQRCDNIVCRATLRPKDAFCKRCSCCICHKYDDNKDPSLWLLCLTEYRSQKGACGASCHIECLLKHIRGGILKNVQCTPLDGFFYCIHCGNVNDILGFLRKQLIYAKDVRRVDNLYYRVSLCQRILDGTEKYQGLLDIVDTAMRKLEAEIGRFSGLPNMARGIVNRLSVGAEVQRLCANAVDLLDSMFLSGSLENPPIKKAMSSSSFIKFEDIFSTSLTMVLDSADISPKSQDLLGYSLWHRMVDTKYYPTEPTGILNLPKRKFTVTNLSPATEYIFKVIAFSNTSELGIWELQVTTEAPVNDVSKSNGSLETNSSSLSNPVAKRDESSNTSLNGCIGFKENTVVKDTEKAETPNSGSNLDDDPHRDSTEQNQGSDVPKSENESYTPGNEMVLVASLPITPSRLESNKPSPSSDILENDPSKPEKDPGSSSKKNSCVGKCKDLSIKDGSPSMKGDYEYCVKVIRWLECKGHIETSFRVKFLTWFSLRAGPQERKIVSVYVDTLLDDPGSLAGQLVDTFSEAVSSKRPQPAPTGFCVRLWH